jgi:hypothetical protein
MTDGKATSMANSLTLVRRISLDDIGTRAAHIIRMRDNWQLAADVLERRSNWLTESEQKNLTELRIVIAFVGDHLTKDFINIERDK